MKTRTASATVNVGELVVLHGRDKARGMLPSKDQPLVDIATKVLDDMSDEFGRVFSGWCLTGLPHKRIPSREAWLLTGDVISLAVTPGTLMMKKRSSEPVARSRPVIDAEGYMVIPGTGERVYVEPEHRSQRDWELELVDYGVPYGAHARLILHYLQKQALKTNNRHVELGQSLRAWLHQLGVEWGGNTIRQFQEQAHRIAASHMVFQWMQGEAQGWGKGGYLQMGERVDDGEPKIWDDEVVLDPLFFQALRKHGAPVQDAAIRALQSRSMSLDIYTFLSWRLHALTRPTGLPWHAVKDQFGRGFLHPRSFRQKFLEALKAALAAYPTACVDVVETGLVLHPSRPPVSKLQIVGFSPVAQQATAKAAAVEARARLRLVEPPDPPRQARLFD